MMPFSLWNICNLWRGGNRVSDTVNRWTRMSDFQFVCISMLVVMQRWFQAKAESIHMVSQELILAMKLALSETLQLLMIM
jgi:hypothetical protein